MHSTGETQFPKRVIELSKGRYNIELLTPKAIPLPKMASKLNDYPQVLASAHKHLGHSLAPGHNNWSSPNKLTCNSTVPNIPNAMANPSKHYHICSRLPIEGALDG